MKRNKYLGEFLKIYWLRPETALWRSVDALFLKNIKPTHPAMDLGCGDGCFQFVVQGGKFDLDFDVFQSTSTKGFWKHKDIYDFLDENFNVKIIKKPKFVFDVGFDHKEKLLKKSEQLSIYKRLVVGDANKKLPFEDNSFKFIFSNILYWIENLDGLIKELNRVIKPGGILVITVPTKAWELYRPTHKPELMTKNKILIRILKKLNRGRSDSYFHVYEPEVWNKILEKHGFTIKKQNRYLSRRLIMLWDIGLRPFSPVTIKIERMLDSLRIKRYIKLFWITFFSFSLNRLAVLRTKDDGNYPPAFLGIVAYKMKS